MSKRYEVFTFPSLYGTPWNTDHLWVARLWARWRLYVLFDIREFRVIDRVTGDHYVF